MDEVRETYCISPRDYGGRRRVLSTDGQRKDEGNRVSETRRRRNEDRIRTHSNAHRQLLFSPIKNFSSSDSSFPSVLCFFTLSVQASMIFAPSFVDRSRFFRRCWSTFLASRLHPTNHMREEVISRKLSTWRKRQSAKESNATRDRRKQARSDSRISHIPKTLPSKVPLRRQLLDHT